MAKDKNDRPGRRGPDKFDMSPEARKPPVEYRKPLSAHTIFRVVDAKLRFPEATDKDISEMTGVERHTVGLALKTPMAIQRLDSAYDIRPVVKARIRSQALDSMEYLSKTLDRANRDLDNDEKAPDAALLSAATRTALETLKGVGLLKDYSVAEEKVLEPAEVADLLAKTNALSESLQADLQAKMESMGLEEAMAEDSGEGEVVVGEEESRIAEKGLDGSVEEAYDDGESQEKPTDS